MKHEISFEDEVVLVILSGSGVSPQAYGAVAHDIVNLPQWKPGMKILIDYSQLDLQNETGADADVYAQAIIPYKTRLGNSRCACVNTSPAEYGLGRMWQYFMNTYTHTRVEVFYSYEEAVRWLSEPEP